MNRHNILLRRLLASLALVGAVSCTGKYEEYNKNPYEPGLEDMKADDYLLRALVLNLQDKMMPEQENFSQFADCLMPGSFSGYIADSNLGTTWSGRFATYNPPSGWYAVPFADFYSNFYPDYFQLRNQSDNELYLALAELYRIATMLRVTDTYGPIPYSKVGVQNAIKSPYDSQREVYMAMFDELEKVIATLEKFSGTPFNASADRIYQGNTRAWAKFANSLKLRMAMRVVYADEALARKKAEEAVASGVGVMTEVADGAYKKVADHNPWERFMPNWDDARVSADLICYMNGYKDPRRSAYYGESTFAEVSKGGYTGTDSYVGLRRGIRQGSYNSWSHGYSSMRVTTTDDIVVMLASEVTFLRAEGAARGWEMRGTAKALYEQAVRMSFEERKVSANLADTYLANATDVVQGYNDPLRGQNGQAYDYSGSIPSSITVAWDDAAPFEEQLERIITQKWIANFPNTMEAWNDYRRTGYPKLMPAVANLSGGVVDDTEGARRVPYPTSEYQENGDNVKAAIETLTREAKLKRGDSWATHLWWDCKQ